jgi:type IV secretion system protein VirD4
MGAGAVAIHRARFARQHELRSLLSRTPCPDGVLLGTIRYFLFFNRFVVVRPTKNRREIGNTLIVAPTRGGKGLLAVSQLLTWEYSAVVNDIKGELFHATAGYRKLLGDVFVIDPTGVGHRFDPLHGKQTEDEFFSTASHLLFEAEERERIFTQRATVMLTQMFLAARIEDAPPFLYVRYLIRSGLTSVVARLDHLDPELATQFLDTNFEKANLTDRFLLSSWGTLTARLRPLLTETVIRSLTGSDFTPEDLLRGESPVTVYLRWKEQDLLALSPLVRLLWGSLISELITSYDTNQGRGCKPILLLLDEAGRTAIPSLAEHATTVVGRGIYLWVAVQSLSQLDVVYGRPRSQVLRDNMETQLYYRPTDLATAEHIERSLGKQSAYAHSTTERGGAETSIGATEQGVPLLTAQEIRQLKDEEVIGFHRHLPPFRMKRVDWRQSPVFQQRHSIPAPELPTLPQIVDISDIRKGSQTAPTSSAYIDPDMPNPTGETIIIDFSRRARNKDRRN